VRGRALELEWRSPSDEVVFALDDGRLGTGVGLEGLICDGGRRRARREPRAIACYRPLGLNSLESCVIPRTRVCLARTAALRGRICQHGARKLRARRDPQLGKDPVQVRPHRPV
jgi:hypothetical protein